MKRRIVRPVLILGIVLSVLSLLVLKLSDVYAQETFTRLPLSILDVAFSPNGQYVARVYANGNFDVLNIQNNQLYFQNNSPENRQLWSAKVAWSLQGDQLAIGIGATISIWSVTDQTLELTHEYAAGGIDELVYFENSTFLPEGFVSLEWDSTSTLLMAKSVSSRLTVWSKLNHSLIADQVLGTNPIRVVWVLGTLQIASIDSIFDIQTQSLKIRNSKRIAQLAGECNVTTSLQSSSDGQSFVQGTYTGCVVMIDADTGNEVAGFKISDVPIDDANYSPNGKQIVAIDREGYVRVIDTTTGNIAVVDHIAGELYTVDWSMINNQIAYAGIDKNQETFYATVDVTEVEKLLNSKDVYQSEIKITFP